VRQTPGPRRWPHLALLAFGMTAGLAACAAPPLKVYTLDAPAVLVDTGPAQMPASLEVWRIVLPDYLDTQDIVLREGSQINRSNHARWASRLSIGATDLITARLAATRPDLFITDQPLVSPARYRLFINISRLDVSWDGTTSLAADWTIVPRDERRPELHDRTAFALTGPVKTDADIVALTNAVLDELAVRIERDVGPEMPQPGYR
jgi:uncharacterized lipoprotein YmbA